MDSILDFDFSILNFIQEHLRCAFMDGAMSFFSYIGEAGLVWIVFSVVLLFFKKTRVIGIASLAAMAITYTLNDLVLKQLIGRPRPFSDCYEQRLLSEADLIIKKPSGAGFPSGHSAIAGAVTTTMFLHNKKLGFCVLVPALLVVFSRLYNYVHFPTDVLCGILLGVIVAIIVTFAFKKTKVYHKLLP